MKWPWPHLRFSDIAAIVFSIVVVSAVGFGLMRYGSPKEWAAKAFGPDWDCTAMPRGDPVCVKKMGAAK